MSPLRATSGSRSRAAAGSPARSLSRSLSPSPPRALLPFTILLHLTASSLGCGPPSRAAVPVVNVAGVESSSATVEATQAAEPSAEPARKPPAIAWETSEVEARRRAKARGQPLLVFLFAAWAVPAVEMDRATWSDPRVAARARSFVPLRLDVSSTDANAQADADRFDLVTVPSLVILDPGGAELARVDGLARPEQVLAAMSLADGGGDH